MRQVTSEVPLSNTDGAMAVLATEEPPFQLFLTGCEYGVIYERREDDGSDEEEEKKAVVVLASR